MEIITITSATTILKVNKMSSSKGCSGSTNMAMIINTSAGIPRPAKSKADKFCRIVDRLRVLMRETIQKVSDK